MKKAFDQTVRDLKRGVNKKVLKVPSIEQKVLDATSNEAWGPHGSVLADIAQSTKNYHEYQMIMAVIWKRINDTGKNWRHVYKALTVLEYLVAHGSERVIDDIREHGYQISTLSDFQYIDSSGRDQGNNIRKKSQSLVVLVNDKERLQEVRQKAAANRDKYRTTTVGGMYRPGSGSYGDKYDDDRYDGRYGNRDDDRNGYGRERDWASRDDNKGRYGDSYGQEGDRYGQYGEDRSSRDGYKDDDYRGRSQTIGDYSYGSRSRSADGDRYRPTEDDEQHSSRGSGARADENSQDGRLDRKYSEQSLGAPPSYEEAVSAGHSPTYSERDRESSASNAPKASSPTAASPTYTATTAPAPVGPASPSAAPVSSSTSLAQPTAQDSKNMEEFGFDEFDPRGASSAAPTTSLAPAVSDVEVDLLGSLSESFSSNALALVTTNTEVDSSVIFNSGSTTVAAPFASTVNDQPFDDPFGDGPFKAISSADTIPVQQHITASTDSTSSFEAAPQNAFGVEPTNPQTFQSTGIEDIDILADILPPSAPSSSSSINAQNGYDVPPQPMSRGGFNLQTNQPPPQFGLPFQGNSFQPQASMPGSVFPAQPHQHLLQTNPLQSVESVPQTGFTNQTMALTFPVQAVQASQPVLSTQGGLMQPNHHVNLNFYGNYNAQSVAGGGPPPSGFGAGPHVSGGPFLQQNTLTQAGSAHYMPSQMGPQVSQVRPTSGLTSTISSTPVSTGPVSQPPKEKFEMKSSVWADTLSRGLVDLNISGHKTNPLADIGVDFDSINRKEKRMEKPSAASTTTVTSTVTMGKAMGSGSGLGRAGASVLTAPPNPMMGSGNMGMGGYGVGQPMGRGMGPGMEMNMGPGQGFNMQQQSGFPPGSAMPGNPYYGRPPYGGGYR